MTRTNTRGRPKTYNREDALNRITEVFWQHGFAATSLDMIAAASGMKRPSLYAAFGDKRAMFLLTQTRFAERLSSELSQFLQLSEPPKVVLRKYFGHLIKTYAAKPEQQFGCFVYSVGLIEAYTENEIGLLVQQVSQRTQDDISAVLDRAGPPSDPSSAKDTALMASLFVSLMHSLSIRARAGTEQSELTRLANEIIEFVLD